MIFAAGTIVRRRSTKPELANWLKGWEGGFGIVAKGTSIFGDSIPVVWEDDPLPWASIHTTLEEVPEQEATLWLLSR